MTDRRKKDPKHLAANLPARAGYDVGYGKPPLETRFRPGQSGNPRGRPKGARNTMPKLNEERLKGIVLEEAYRTVKVRDGEKQITVPVAQAVIRALAVNAAKGQYRAQRLFAELVSATEASNKRLYDHWLDTALEYKASWDRELERRRRLGIEGPEPVPHPDQIELDMRTGEIVITGPFTKEEKARLDWLREQKAEFEQELSRLREILSDNPEPEHKHVVEEEIATYENVLAMMRVVIPD